MRAQAARRVAALLAGGVGLAVAATIPNLPPGVGHGTAVALMAAVLGSTSFWTIMTGAVVGLVLLIEVIGRTAARRSERTIAAARRAAEPMAWGLALPALALVLDPWWLSSTAPALLFAGAALGTLTACQRCAWLGGELNDVRGQKSVGRGGRAAQITIACVVVVLPIALVALGPRWSPPLSGDEPHYLLYARSILVDGDIDMARDYNEGAYRSFYPPDLPPHSKPSFDPATRYSMHSIGLAALLVPWFAIAKEMSVEGFTMVVRASMVLWLGAFAVVLFELLRDLGGLSAARRGTAVAVLTGPLLFMAPHLFPEVPALTISAGAYLILRRRPGPGGAFAAGLLIALLPWLGVKYLAMAAALAVVGLIFLSRGKQAASAQGSGPSRGIVVVGFVLPLVVTSLAHVGFTWSLYRSWSPLVIYFGSAGAPGREFLFRTALQEGELLAYLFNVGGIGRTAIGLFLDQKEGLLLFAPQYLLAIAGLAWLWKRRRTEALALVAIFAAHWGLYSVSQELGGWSTPARPLVAVLWTLAIPMGVALALPLPAGRRGRVLAAARGGLVAAGAGLTVMLLVQPHLLYHDYRVFLSLPLRRYGAPGLPLWEFFPLWVHFEQPQWVASLLWLAATIAAGWVLWRVGAAAGNPIGAGGEATGAGDDPLGTGAHPTGADTDRSDQGREASTRPSALPTARAVIVAGVCLVLVRHLLVPVTALHVPHDYAPDGTSRTDAATEDDHGVTVWTSNTLYELAWPEADGIWVRGGDGVLFPLAASRRIASVTVEVSSLAQMRARVQLGRDHGVEIVRERAPATFTLSPGPARSWGEAFFYRLGVDAPEGISPAELGRDPRDRRQLGLYLRFLSLEFE